MDCQLTSLANDALTEFGGHCMTERQGTETTGSLTATSPMPPHTPPLAPVPLWRRPRDKIIILMQTTSPSGPCRTPRPLLPLCHCLSFAQRCLIYQSVSPRMSRTCALVSSPPPTLFPRVSSSNHYHQPSHDPFGQPPPSNHHKNR